MQFAHNKGKMGTAVMLINILNPIFNSCLQKEQCARNVVIKISGKSKNYVVQGDYLEALRLSYQLYLCDDKTRNAFAHVSLVSVAACSGIL